MKTDEVPDVKNSQQPAGTDRSITQGITQKNNSSAIVWRDISYDLVRVPLVDIDWSQTD